MPTENDRSSSLAVLIDADSARCDIIDAVLTNIAKLGTESQFLVRTKGTAQ